MSGWSGPTIVTLATTGVVGLLALTALVQVSRLRRSLGHDPEESLDVLDDLEDPEEEPVVDKPGPLRTDTVTLTRVDVDSVDPGQVGWTDVDWEPDPAPISRPIRADVLTARLLREQGRAQ